MWIYHREHPDVAHVKTVYSLIETKIHGPRDTMELNVAVETGWARSYE